MSRESAQSKSSAGTFFGPPLLFHAGAALLLVGSFLYVWLRVEPLLEYHSCGPYFFRQRSFMEAFMVRPGGPADYAGVFLAQLNCVNWLGALAFVLCECLALLGAVVCLARISGRAPGFTGLAPLFVLLLLRNRYGCPVPALSVGWLLALTASAVHVLLPWQRPWLAMVTSGIMSGLLFYLAGLWSALLFAVLSGWFVFMQMRNWPAALGCVVLAFVGPLLAFGPGNLEFARLVNPWPEGVGWALATALYASVPVAGVVLALLPQSAAAPSSQPRMVSPTRGTGGRFRTAWLGHAVAVLAFLLGCGAVWLTFDRHRRLLAEIDYESSRGHHAAVLVAARQAKALDHAARVHLHLALYHTGRLAEELFSFRNMIEDAPAAKVGEDWRAQSQALFELGLVNDAEHVAHEALELEGNRPDLLRLLARINLLKNRPQAARVFLNVLSLIPFQGQRANEDWPTTDPQVPLAEQALLAQMRPQQLTDDAPHEGLPIVALLEVLLASQPTNQMAFEFLMAECLMELDLKRAVEHLRLLDKFNYARIPRPYEEALLLYQQAAGVRADLKGRTVRPETVERFRQFIEAVKPLEGGAEAIATLASRFGDTYWYYFTARSLQRAARGEALGR